MKIALFGTGIYGLAIAKELAKKDNKIIMWSESKEKVEEYNKTKKLASIYDTKIAKNIKVTNDIEETLLNTELIFITCASKYVDSLTRSIKPYFKENMCVCIASKGIDDKKKDFLSNIVENNLNTKNVSVISGPTFAVDMLNNAPIALALAANNNKTKNMVLSTLSNDTLKLRPTRDLIGIQLCGTIKNCIAVASGILKGLGYPESTQIFLINESMHDIKKIIHLLGGKKKTILSFAGIGDLTLTCLSEKSRNFSFGYIIGSTKSEKKINEYLENNTVEGYYAINLIYKMLKKKKINIPLIDIIYDIVYKKEDPKSLIKFLIEKE